MWWSWFDGVEHPIGPIVHIGAGQQAVHGGGAGSGMLALDLEPKDCAANEILRD